MRRRSALAGASGSKIERPDLGVVLRGEAVGGAGRLAEALALALRRAGFLAPYPLHPLAVELGNSSALATSAISWPSATNLSASLNFLVTCSGVCRRRLTLESSSRPLSRAGRTLIRGGPSSGGRPRGIGAIVQVSSRRSAHADRPSESGQPASRNDGPDPVHRDAPR